MHAMLYVIKIGHTLLTHQRKRDARTAVVHGGAGQHRSDGYAAVCCVNVQFVAASLLSKPWSLHLVPRSQAWRNITALLIQCLAALSLHSARFYGWANFTATWATPFGLFG